MPRKCSQVSSVPVRKSERIIRRDAVAAEASNSTSNDGQREETVEENEDIDDDFIRTD